MKKHIPNTLTCLNLFTGCLAIIEVFSGNLDHIIYYVLIAGVFDFLDGFAARMLKVTSAIGADLDSLADMVTFGLLPSVVMYQLIGRYTDNAWMPYFGLVIAVFAALRLAKFNNDEEQKDQFIGLNTPASTFFIVPLPLLIREGIFDQLLTQSYVLMAFVIGVSLMMVAPIPMIALKFKHFRWTGNEPRYLVMVLAVVGMVTFQWSALPFIIVLYVLTSIFTNLLKTNN